MSGKIKAGACPACGHMLPKSPAEKREQHAEDMRQRREKDPNYGQPKRKKKVHTDGR